MSIGPQPITATERRELMERLWRERMDNTYYPTPDEWRRQLERHGYRMPDRGLTGSFQPSQETKPAPIQKMTMDEYQRMVDLAKQIPPPVVLYDPKIATSPLPSTQKPVEPDKDHIWNMIVLAAQSSRYGS
jgi:hypothetical protein